MKNTLSISGLHASFNGRTVISNFSLELQRGQNTVIVGESGSGKSTLLNCIMGFVPGCSGRIIVDGIEIDCETIWRARCRMALVQQEPQPGDGKVREVLARPFGYRGNRELEFDEGLLEELLDRFRLSEEILQKDFGELSGGQKQRVVLVSALLLKRPILLLDEVSSALDQQNTAAVIDYLLGMEDTTIIAVAHDRQMHRIADLTVTLNGDAGQ